MSIWIFTLFDIIDEDEDTIYLFFLYTNKFCSSRLVFFFFPCIDLKNSAYVQYGNSCFLFVESLFSILVISFYSYLNEEFH